jgi:hypothetical protein
MAALLISYEEDKNCVCVCVLRMASKLSKSNL